MSWRNSGVTDVVQLRSPGCGKHVRWKFLVPAVVLDGLDSTIENAKVDVLC